MTQIYVPSLQKYQKQIEIKNKRNNMSYMLNFAFCYFFFRKYLIKNIYIIEKKKSKKKIRKIIINKKQFLKFKVKTTFVHKMS